VWRLDGRRSLTPAIQVPHFPPGKYKLALPIVSKTDAAGMAQISAAGWTLRRTSVERV
jgi:hypothetical protein